MDLYKILSVLLCYPEQELVDSLDEIKDYLASCEIDSSALQPLLAELASKDLITLQENYVQTFDRTPTQSLHMFEHIHGEDRIRGQAMVDLLDEYQQAGFEPVADELPDYLPLFLEFLTVCDAEKAENLLGTAIHVISHVGKKLEASNATYAGVFQVLEKLTSVKPEPLVVPPIRDMDEALEKFGPTIEGIEPLLQPNIFSGLNTSALTNACSTCTTQERESK